MEQTLLVVNFKLICALSDNFVINSYLSTVWVKDGFCNHPNGVYVNGKKPYFLMLQCANAQLQFFFLFSFRCFTSSGFFFNLTPDQLDYKLMFKNKKWKMLSI
jgi:hypothetical protein